MTGTAHVHGYCAIINILGLFPFFLCLVVLYAPDMVLIERNSGKRLDPVTEGAVCVGF